MTYYAYNAFLRLVCEVDHPGNCPPGCEFTTDEPPAAPWPDGFWPHYLDDGWELTEVQHLLAG